MLFSFAEVKLKDLEDVTCLDIVLNYMCVIITYE